MGKRNSNENKLTRSYNRRADLPKRPPNAYNLFVRKMRVHARLISPLWKNLSPFKKKKYKDIAEQLYQNYIKEKNECQRKPVSVSAFTEKDNINKEKKERGEKSCKQTVNRNICFNPNGIYKNFHDSMNESMYSQPQTISIYSSSKKAADDTMNAATTTNTDIDQYLDSNIDVTYSNFYNSRFIDSTNHRQCKLDRYVPTDDWKNMSVKEPRDYGMKMIDSETTAWLLPSDTMDNDSIDDIDSINHHHHHDDYAVDADDPMDCEWLKMLLPEYTGTSLETTRDATQSLVPESQVMNNDTSGCTILNDTSIKNNKYFSSFVNCQMKRKELFHNDFDEYDMISLNNDQYTRNSKDLDSLTTNTTGTNSTDIIVSTTDPNKHNINNYNNDTKDDNDTSHTNNNIEREQYIHNCYLKRFSSSFTTKKHSILFQLKSKMSIK